MAAGKTGRQAPRVRLAGHRVGLAGRADPGGTRPQGPRENAACLPADTRDKTKVGVDNVVDEVQRLTGRIQTELKRQLHAATRSSPTGHARQGRDVAQTGVARLP